MKKIFATIIALAALVSCNTEAVDEVVSTPQYFTTSLEVDLDGDTRVFDNNLVWSWESTDEIAAYQVAGDQIVNTLSLKDNGKFGIDEFKYATNDSADFVFVYPVEALKADKSLGYVQTGEWTPTLVGIVENATVNNIGTVEMKHMSAAFEIRVWDEGSNKDHKTPKTIKEAKITSKTDGGVSASLTNLSTNTVVFNVAGGEDKDKKVVVYDITLVDTNGRTYTVSNKELTFVNGQRTILNVEWKNPKPATVSCNIYTSYTNKDNSLDGRTIYVKDVVLTNADSATIALYLNGNKAADLTPGKTTTVSNLALGEYKAVVKWSVNGEEYASDVTTVYVTGVPCVADYLNDSYRDWSFAGSLSFTTKEVKVNVGSFFSPSYEYYYYKCAFIAGAGTFSSDVYNGAIVSPEFGKNVSFGVTVDMAAQSRNVDFSIMDSATYGNVYLSAGTKASTGVKSDIYCTSTYSAEENPVDDAMNTYTGAVSGVVVSPSAPCLVCYRESKRYDGYIYKIKVEYTK